MPARSAAKAPQRLIWVEGKDDSAVVQSLCAKHEIPEVFAVRDKKGVDDVLHNFYTELRARTADRFGLIVDANGDADARWASIRHTLFEEGYTDVPERLSPGGMIVPGTMHRPMFGAWIMPDNGSPGALEEFVATLVPAADTLWERAANAVDSIPEGERRFPTVRRTKAQMHTWLAWQEYPGSPMGQAIGKGDLDAHAPKVHPFITWLRRLMVDDPSPAPLS